MKEGPTSPELWEQLARIQIRRSKLAKARASYVALVDLYPEDPVTRRTEARLAYAEGRYAKASEILRSLRSLQDNPELLHLIARAELAQGNLHNAAAAIGDDAVGGL